MRSRAESNVPSPKSQVLSDEIGDVGLRTLAPPTLDMGRGTSNIRLIAIVGPTAVGKTSLAIRLAETFNGEIIGADSRQIYRHMDIGTAKPTAAERARVPHHLIDVVAPDETLTLAQYKQLANAAIADIAARGKLPFLVGGTGL